MTTIPDTAPAEVTHGWLTPRTFYRTLAIAEAITWTLLIVGMLLKYVADLGGLPVLIGGSIHGLVFITYATTSAMIGVNQNWSLGRIVLAIGSAVIPYATIPFDIAMDRRGALDGGWHTVATDDPRDAVWTRRLLRWFLNRPALLAVVFVVVVLAIMTVLLIIGPPGGWS